MCELLFDKKLSAILKTTISRTICAHSALLCAQSFNSIHVVRKDASCRLLSS